MRWQWREDSIPGTPWENMATDLAVFEGLQHEQNALPVVRIYSWDRPSVSIGRLQDEAAVRRVFGDLPLVRRPTGGRAVVHGEDLTISVVVRSSELPIRGAAGVLSSYRQIVSGIVYGFTQSGVAASLGIPGHRSDNVDCFAEAARCDLIDTETGRKLAGCAQRRERGVILQQMSIPLRVVPDGPAAFLRATKEGLGEALGATEWLSVDTPFPV